MPMSPRLLRPRQTTHPEAAAWRSAVVANGGSVSGTTLSAVDKFCKAIASAGIRDRFYRLNLFCGTGLNACLVPLYRGPSLGGTQYGGTTDANVGPFVSGDYAETGASGGLTPNGVGTKRLDTGLTQTALGVDSCHLSVYEIAKPNAGAAYRVRIGSRGASAAHEHLLTNAVAEPIVYGCGANSSLRATASSYAESGAFWLGSNTTATSSSLFKNGLSAGAGSPATRTAQNVPYFVFALNDNGSLGDAMITGRLGAYSIGLGMTSAQAAAYNAAMQAFQTALGRNV